MHAVLTTGSSPSSIRVARYPPRMVEPTGPSATPSLDNWIAEAGEPAVLAAVDELKGGIADGTAPALRDGALLRAYWDRRRRQTP